jgi:hypothetical protein
MITPLLLLPFLSIPPRAQVAEPAPAAVAQAQKPEDAEFEKRKTEAGNDVGKLWKLYEWCRDKKRDKDGKATLKKILKLDPNHKEANIALGNVFYDGKWFPSQAKVDEYKKAKEAEEKRAQGLVEWKGQWVPPEDVPFLERGLVRDDSGAWVNPAEAKKLQEGWVRQDFEWIPPAETENVTKGLWKCDGKWLTLEEADKFHAEIGQWWRIPGERFHIYTTCDRDLATQKVKRELEAAYDELARAYGTKPATPVIVIVLRDGSQYSSYAAGDEAEQRPSTDALGLSSVHYAYYADAAMDPDTGAFLGAGVGYWDASTKDGPRWGVHSVRHALGQSFGEALDLSPKTIERTKKTRMTSDQFWESFYDEKRVPRWFRYGAAAYAERYYRDNTVGIGGDPLWARKWSIQNIVTRGGLRPLKQLFEFKLTVDGGPDSTKLINEAGLVVAFALDGENAAVGDKLKKLQEAIAGGKDKKTVGEAGKALEAELIKQEAELKKFAGL